MRRLSESQVFILLSGLSVGGGLAVLWMTSSVNPLRGDSAEYLYFDPSRTVGYPAFLSLFRLATGHVALAVPAQILLLATSLLLLSWSFHRLVGRPAYSIAFQLLILANAGMWFTAAFLMTEALSTALVALWCAQLLHMVRSPRGCRLLIVISCVATMVRPSLLPLFFGTALFALVAEPARGRARAIAMIAAAAVAAWSATPIAQLIVRGSAHTTSPLARGVLQHTLYCDPKRVPSNADSGFVESSAEPVRRYISSSPAGMQEQLRREYSTPLRFGLIIPALGRRHHLYTRSDVDPYLAPIARERMIDNPACYAKSVANEYLRLAVFDTDPTAEDARRVNGFVESHPPPVVPQLPVLPGDDRLARAAALEVGNAPAGLNPLHEELKVVGNIPLSALLPFRLLHAVAALIGLLSLLLLPLSQRLGREARNGFAAAAAMGLSLHGILAITAIVEIGFYRYLVPCWPLVCTLPVLTAVWVRRVCRAQRTALHEPKLVVEPMGVPT